MTSIIDDDTRIKYDENEMKRENREFYEIHPCKTNKGKLKLNKIQFVIIENTSILPILLIVIY